MNRKQVYAFLKVMGKDNSRPVLATGKIDELDGKPVLVATDGYILTAVYLDEEAKDLVGRIIRRESFERWYKLADGRARLTYDELERISDEEYHREGSWLDVQYPKWQGLVPKERDTDGFTKDMSIAFNADFVKIVQDLNADTKVKIDLYGKLAPMVIKTEQSFSMIMPMKG